MMLWWYIDLFCNCSVIYVKIWVLGSILWEIWNNSLLEKSNSIFRGFYVWRGVYLWLNIYLVFFVI